VGVLILFEGHGPLFMCNRDAHCVAREASLPYYHNMILGV
jgi:hypothetical protein